MTTAVIAGASGLVGGHCLRGLFERYERVISLGRRRLPMEHPRLEQLVVRFETLEPFDEFRGADVVCALGTTIRKAGSEAAFRLVDCGYPVRLAEAASRAGARSYSVVSSVGAAAQSRNFYLRVKGEMEDAVRATSIPSVHIFRPSFLLGDRSEPRPGERIGSTVARATSWLLVGALRKYRPVSAAVVARAIIDTAERGVPGRFVHHFY